MDHLDRVNNMNENNFRQRELADEEFTKNMLGPRQGITSYERLSEDYGHRRYVRKHVANKFNRVY